MPRPGSANTEPRTSPPRPADHQPPATPPTLPARRAASTETPTGSSTIPPATGRSPPGCRTSTSRPSPRSPTPAGPLLTPPPGTKSEHPLGRACDITFGNQIGQRPNPAQLEAGWRVTNWMKDNADVLGLQYLIWQGQIWSLARDADGWRPYNGGGMHDPASITGGHYDHLHVTVKVGA